MNKPPVDYELDEPLEPLNSMSLAKLKEWRTQAARVVEQMEDLSLKKIYQSHIDDIDALIEAHYERIKKTINS